MPKKKKESTEEVLRAAVPKVAPKRINDLSVGDVVKLSCTVDSVTKTSESILVRFLINGTPVSISYPTSGDPGLTEVVSG